MVSLPFIIALLSMIGPFSIDTPFPAFSLMAREFGVASTEMQLVVTVYMAAFAVMSIFHGPLSDAIGRRPVIVGACAVYALASVGAALSPNLAVLLVFRAIQGLSAGGSTIIARTLVRDLYDGEQAQRLMSQVSVIFSIAPALAPIIGGLLLQVGDWHLVFWFMAALGLFLIAAVCVMLPETHPVERRTPLRIADLLFGLAQVFRTPDFHRSAWAMTFAFGGQFLYIGGAAIFIGELLGQGELDYWKFFVPMVGCLMLGGVISGRLGRRVSSTTIVTWGLSFSAVASVVGVVIAMLAGPHLPWAVIGPSLIALGVGAAYPNQNLLILDLFPRRRGSVMSAATFTTLMFNAISAVTITPLVGGSVVTFALAASILVLLGLSFWVWHLHATRDRRPVG
ncbi:multidrug effflux MFS transporter [Nocardioides rotundus]|uniref:multidrug effflux MFS transporter n=1 Tax=Nocardioides rotundus TaxID=1774216 RepID=UPI001CBBF740|nr:multidrug effflux MFS transporter [Nocardioides rotundus]UAL30316.1 multidrug effflux MFS transporter [Nocardioides rotundus]